MAGSGSLTGDGQIFRDIDFHVEDPESMGFALGIGLEALAPTPAQGVVKNEIEGQQVVRLVSIDLAKKV